MKLIEFEEYLMDEFFKDEPSVLDDDIPDAFNDWLETLDVNDVIEYGEKFAKYVYKKYLKEND